jgi:mRNA interferase RelE/StbE
MKTDFTTAFDKDVEKIINVPLLEKIEQAITSVEDAQMPPDIPELKKLKGYKKGIYFRIKVGRYRIGVEIEGDLVTFDRCLPRKDFYKYFP